MSFHNDFVANNPRAGAVLNVLVNGLPDALDYGSGQANTNQRTERTPPVDAATNPPLPPPSPGLPPLVTIGAVVAGFAVLLLLARMARR